jgi:hypothetical protein
MVDQAQEPGEPQQDQRTPTDEGAASQQEPSQAPQTGLDRQSPMLKAVAHQGRI